MYREVVSALPAAAAPPLLAGLTKTLALLMLQIPQKEHNAVSSPISSLVT
jgi:hypothetical protein